MFDGQVWSFAWFGVVPWNTSVVLIKYRYLAVAVSHENIHTYIYIYIHRIDWSFICCCLHTTCN